MRNLLIYMIILPMFIMLFVGQGFLQVLLSKSKSKWPGLVLPIVNFCFSVLVMIVMAIRLYNGTTFRVFPILFVFILCNVPTLILMVIAPAADPAQAKTRPIRPQVAGWSPDPGAQSLTTNPKPRYG